MSLAGRLVQAYLKGRMYEPAKYIPRLGRSLRALNVLGCHQQRLYCVHCQHNSQLIKGTYLAQDCLLPA